jgi:hypothetical protein
MGRTILKLDARKAMVSGENDLCMLGPDAPEDAGLLERTKAFENGFHDKLKKLGLDRTLKEGGGH